MNEIRPIEYRGNSYTCPHCKAVAQMKWLINEVCIRDNGQFYLNSPLKSAEPDYADELGLAECEACHNIQIWLNEDMIYPQESTIAPANEDMPSEVKKLYEEASSIFDKSPRAATALLRLAVQLLCKELGEKGENINDDIAALVQKGLSSEIQMAMDSIRVIGNNAVHPGKIELNDNKEIACSLFSILNFIVEAMITRPKMIKVIYKGLPKGALDAIDKRDNKK